MRLCLTVEAGRRNRRASGDAADDLASASAVASQRVCRRDDALSQVLKLLAEGCDGLEIEAEFPLRADAAKADKVRLSTRPPPEASTRVITRDRRGREPVS